MPEENDIQPDEAIAIAKAAIIEAYGLKADALDEHRVDIAFETHASDWERKNLHYNINFWGEGLGYYSCSVTRDGRVMDSRMDEGILSPEEQLQRKAADEEAERALETQLPKGSGEQWSLADKAKYLGGDNGIPGEGGHHGGTGY